MRLAAFQFDVRRGEVAANRAAVERGLEAAARAEVELLLLPEMWPTSFLAGGAPLGDPRTLAPLLEASDAAVASAAARAAELGLALCGSAYGPGEEGEAPRNRLTLWSQGAELLRYDKVHLFALTAEHLAFSAGERPPPTATLPRRGGGELLVSGFVCYDLRFGPLVDAARAGGAELLLVPAQWPVPRATQWRALLAGRAVETQAVVLGCNRCGRESLGRRGLGLEFPGNSLICGPDGAELAAAAGSGEQLVVAEVDWSQVGELRRAVRIADDRRPDLYRRW